MNVYEILDNLGISYEVVHHPPVYTAHEGDLYIKGREGVRSKNLFLTNKKKTKFFLLVMDDSRRLELQHFGELVGEKKLKFVSAELLEQKLGVPKGAVTIFGLLNNPEKDIQVYLEKEMMSEEKICFSPNVNDQTLFLSIKDMMKFLEHQGNPVQIVDLQAEILDF
ncbi:Ala-tRNA(Pro) deacylase [Pilibacter termitis]|uniref:Ala-tRNA(Pro) deacylase n=1 Tax=Pilibacter termitis TaxID=263852 RepID=A0A1T4K3U0_9ENTE|nr:prolyl-tRNA synthetase associated domain-containing protein [Pilibacter termitis]SJZ37094.1 Ala-tRNA(Pro) deacylase [Pilibacter termitis]